MSIPSGLQKKVFILGSKFEYYLAVEAKNPGAYIGNLLYNQLSK
jgi:hypothetical protein